MKFSVVAESFEKIEQERSRLVITQLLGTLFTQASTEDIYHVCTMALGTLRPSYKGMQFNIAQKSIIDPVARLLKKDTADVARAVKTAGDVGTFIAHAYHGHGSGRTVLEIYHALTVIEGISGTGSVEQKSDAVYALLQEVSAIEAKYIIRIILGTLRLGFSDMTIIDGLSWMVTGDKSLHTAIERAYSICADLGHIASILKKEGAKGLDNVTIQLGIPIRPASAERLPTAHDIFEKIGSCVAQPKLDGFRLQIHVENKNNSMKIAFFSRHLTDMSLMFPDLVQAFTHIPTASLIVEGEAITYDQYTNSFLPFQETAKRKRKHGIEQAVTEFPLRLYIFDLLYYNGVSFLDEEHCVRRKALEDIFRKVSKDPLFVIEEEQIDSAKSLEQYFLLQLDKGLEGIVVKRKHAHYQPGKRNFNWIKLKYHAQKELEDSIDCVILGYYAGSGKRVSFGIGALLVGVYDKKNDRFETIAKIGTGLSDSGWKELKKKCDAHAVEEQPKQVYCDKALKPDVWIDPVMVISVLADEITVSPVHTAGKSSTTIGFALRFPRFLNYREDKSAYDATTVVEIKKLYEQQGAE